MEQLGSAAASGGAPPPGMPPGFPDMSMLQSIMQTAQSAGVVPQGSGSPFPIPSGSGSPFPFPFPGGDGGMSPGGQPDDARRGRRACKYFRSPEGYVPT